MRPIRALAAAPLLVVVLAAGCGGGGDGGPPAPAARPDLAVQQGDAPTPAAAPSIVVTKNTSRVGGGDVVTDAADAALAVFPSDVPSTRPAAVVLADAGDWRAGVAAAVFMSDPIRAPLLLTRGGALPDVTRSALDKLRPAGAKAAGGAQVIRVGDVPAVEGRATTDLRANDAFALARAIDAFQAAARGATGDRVLVVSADAPAYAMPAAAWAAKSGDTVLFTTRDDLPAETRAALAAHQSPRIYLLGPESVVSAHVERQLRRLGTVDRIAGSDPVSNAIAFARYADGSFGWGITDPGHGLVFASSARPADAGAAAPLSASGTFGPLLLLENAGPLPPALESYLLDIQPGFREDPVRGVYNHGWLVGGDGALSASVQSRIDSLLEIAPVNQRAAAETAP